MQQSPASPSASASSNNTKSSSAKMSTLSLVFLAAGLIIYVQISMSSMEIKLLGTISSSSSSSRAISNQDATKTESVVAPQLNSNNRTMADASSSSSSNAMSAELDQVKERLAKLNLLLETHLFVEKNKSDTTKEEPLTTTAPIFQKEVPTNTLISCKDLMNEPNSPYRDGNFLTRHTIPLTWHPRHDHSRELRHSMCQLHRYTAPEARECLEGKHVFLAGDSLSRYQYMSLATFLHTTQYPPRFGIPNKKGAACPHLDDRGREACSPRDQPNICKEGNWGGTPIDSWQRFIQAVGGPLFDGCMEASAIRKNGDNGIKGSVENYLYVSPASEEKKRFMLSFANEVGWGNSPNPIHGFNFTGCAYQGACNVSDELVEERIQRFRNDSFDFSEVFVDAIGPEGVLRKVFPPVDYAFYNRGIWGTLTDKEKTQNISQRLYDFVGREKGRCFFRTSTGRFQEEEERGHVRKTFLGAGCSYIDYAHVVADFTNLLALHPAPPLQNLGGIPGRAITEERSTIFWDLVHFEPWVYEELNNLKLNILCNIQPPPSDKAR